MKKVNLQATTKPLSGAALGLALEQVASVFRKGVIRGAPKPCDRQTIITQSR